MNRNVAIGFLNELFPPSSVEEENETFLLTTNDLISLVKQVVEYNEVYFDEMVRTETNLFIKLNGKEFNIQLD